MTYLEMIYFFLFSKILVIQEFFIKNLKEAIYILDIKIYRYRSRKLLKLS